MKRTILILTMIALLLLTAACSKVKTGGGDDTTTTTSYFSYAPDVTDKYETPILPAQIVTHDQNAKDNSGSKATQKSGFNTLPSSENGETPIISGETKRASDANALTNAADPKTTTAAPNPAKPETGTSKAGTVTKPSGSGAATPADIETEAFETPIL